MTPEALRVVSTTARLSIIVDWEVIRKIVNLAEGTLEYLYWFRASLQQSCKNGPFPLRRVINELTKSFE